MKKQHGNATHGMRHTPTYTSWLKMRERCTNLKNNRYPRYGGVGIKVCSRWLNSFEAFLQDMGLRPLGMTLDREDSKGDYGPGNCRWATPKQQSRASEKLIEFGGESLCVSDWARRLGITQHALTMRLNCYGWSLERALTTPGKK